MHSDFALLLDLDGTLVDPGRGIIECCRYALTEVGTPAGPFEDLKWIIGPPLRESFAQLLGPDGDVELATQIYRRRYGEWGLYEAEVYAGILEALHELSAMGFTLYLCTSKPRVFAAEVVRHFGLSRYLAGIYGAELDGALENKGDLIAHLLQQEQRVAEEACMIGDRRHDVLGAMKNGVSAVGVSWGYGSVEELTSAGADLIAGSPAELVALARKVLY